MDHGIYKPQEQFILDIRLSPRKAAAHWSSKWK